MSSGTKKQCTLKPLQQLHALYTGASIRLCCDEKTLVAACGEEAKVIDVASGDVLRTLPGDTESVTAIAVHPSGRQAVVASRSYATKLWDLESGRCLRTWQPHKAPVADITFHASGGFVATASAAREVRVWDVDSGSCTHSFNAHSGVVTSALFHSRESIMVTAGDDGIVVVCDLQKKKVACKLNGHVSAVTAIAWAANETRLLSAGRDKVVNVWDIRTYSKIRTVAVLESVESLVVLPDPLAADLTDNEGRAGSRIVFATGGEEGLVKCWSASTCRCVYTQAESHRMQSIHAIVELLMLPSTGQVLVSSADCAITVRNIGKAGAGEVKTLLGNLGEVTATAFVGCMSQSVIPQHVAVATNSDVLYMLDSNSLTCSSSLKGHTDMVLAVASQQIDALQPTWLLASGSKDNSVRVWHAATGKCVAVGEAHMGSVTGVAFFVGKVTTALVSCGADKLLQVWDLAPLLDSVCAGRLPESPVKLSVTAAVAAHEKEIHCVAVSPTNTVVASGSADRCAKLWTLPALSAPITLSGHKRGVWDVQFAPVEQVVLTCSGDSTIKLWGVKDGTCLRTFSGHSASVLKVRFSAAGSVVLSASGDGLIKSWSTYSGQCLSTLKAHDGKVWALEVAASDSECVISGSDTGSLAMWGINSAQAEEEERAQTEEVVQQRQELQNALMLKQHVKAAKLALKLQQPRQLLEIVRAILHAPDTSPPTHKRYIAQLTPLVNSLSQSDMQNVLRYARDWNTSPKNCTCAQALLGAVLAKHSPKDVASVQGLQEMSEALLLYSGRHYDRMDRMLQETYLLDYLLSRMQLYKMSECSYNTRGPGT